jgi:hypothetical protein
MARTTCNITFFLQRASNEVFLCCCSSVFMLLFLCEEGNYGFEHVKFIVFMTTVVFANIKGTNKKTGRLCVHYVIPKYQTQR